MAKSLLDEIGVVDTDGDGMRELPNGDKLTLNLQVATQGISIKIVELVGQSWRDVGINNTVKEVTTDEYRSAQSSNQLDVTMLRRACRWPWFLATLKSSFRRSITTSTCVPQCLWGEYVESRAPQV